MREIAENIEFVKFIKDKSERKNNFFESVVEIISETEGLKKRLELRKNKLE